MAYRYLNAFAFGILFILLFAAAAQGREPGTDSARVARIGAESSQPDRTVDPLDEPDLPAWLEELLTAASCHGRAQRA